MDSLHIFLHLNQCHRYHPVCKYQMPRFCLLSPVYVQVGMNFQVSRTAAVDAESIHCTGTKPRNSHESTTPSLLEFEHTTVNIPGRYRSPAIEPHFRVFPEVMANWNSLRITAARGLMWVEAQHSLVISFILSQYGGSLAYWAWVPGRLSWLSTILSKCRIMALL